MGTIPRIISAMGKIVPPASYLRSNLAVLRPLELTDLDLLYQWENDTSDWAASGTNIPFSRTFLIEYILSAQADIYQAGQMRLAIECPATGKLAGAIDLFDFDAKNRRAAIGIIIDSGHRRLGIASSAIDLLKTYSCEILLLRQLYCTIGQKNTASIKLFAKAGFQQCGHRKDWLARHWGWEDELMFQFFL
jgi:diamine N-acetyltransferase